jgi:hypothetical protein
MPGHTDIDRIVSAVNALRRFRQAEELFPGRYADILAAFDALEGAEAAQGAVADIGLIAEFTVDMANELIADIANSAQVQVWPHKAAALVAEAEAEAGLARYPFTALPTVNELLGFIEQNLFRIAPTEPSFTQPISTTEFPLQWQRDLGRLVSRIERQVVRFPNDPTRREQLDVLIQELRQQDLIPEGDINQDTREGLVNGLLDFMDVAVRERGSLFQATTNIVERELPQIAAGTSEIIRIPPSPAQQQLQAEKTAEFTTKEDQARITRFKDPEKVAEQILADELAKSDEYGTLADLEPGVLQKFKSQIGQKVRAYIDNLPPGQDPLALTHEIEQFILSQLPVISDMQANAVRAQEEKSQLKAAETKAQAFRDTTFTFSNSITLVNDALQGFDISNEDLNRIARKVQREVQERLDQGLAPPTSVDVQARHLDELQQAVTKEYQRVATSDIAGITSSDVEDILTQAGIFTSETSPEERTAVLNSVDIPRLKLAMEQNATTGSLQGDLAVALGLMSPPQPTAQPGFPGPLKRFVDSLGNVVEEGQPAATAGTVPFLSREGFQAQEASAGLTTLFEGQNLENTIRSHLAQAGLLDPIENPQFAANLETNVIPRLVNAVNLKAAQVPGFFKKPADVFSFIDETMGAPQEAGILPFQLTPGGYERQTGRTPPGIPSVANILQQFKGEWNVGGEGGVEEGQPPLARRGFSGPGVLEGISSTDIYQAIRGSPFQPPATGARMKVVYPEAPLPPADIPPFLSEAAGESLPFLDFLTSLEPQLQQEFGAVRQPTPDFGRLRSDFEGFQSQLGEIDTEREQLERDRALLQRSLRAAEGGVEEGQSPLARRGFGEGDPTGRLPLIEQSIAALLARRPTLRRLTNTPEGLRHLARVATPAPPTFGDFFGERLPGLREQFSQTPAALKERLQQQRVDESEVLRQERESEEAERTRRGQLRTGRTVLTR